MQEEFARANKAAWETKAYQAWVLAYCSPHELAEELKQKNKHHLRYWLKYIGNPSGKRILNLLGSNGRKAISLALLGADVTVVDISEENRLYATHVAAEAGVEVDYICSDVLNIPNEEELGEFDIVFMEFGILHYFTDLSPIFSLVLRRLARKGRFILTDFHPIGRALSSGNYFDDGVKEGEVAFAKFLPEEERSETCKVLVRSWTIGDIITAIGATGLFIRTFEEIPNKINAAIPEFYTLIADHLEIDLNQLNPLVQS